MWSFTPNPAHIVPKEHKMKCLRLYTIASSHDHFRSMRFTIAPRKFCSVVSELQQSNEGTDMSSLCVHFMQTTCALHSNNGVLIWLQMLLLLPPLLLFLFVCYTHFRYRRRRMEALAAKISGPPAWPIIGNALEFLGTTHGKEHHSVSFFLPLLHPLCVSDCVMCSVYRCSQHHIPPLAPLPDSSRFLAGAQSLRGRGQTCRHRGMTCCPSVCLSVYLPARPSWNLTFPLSFPGGADEPSRSGERFRVPLHGTLAGAGALHCPR
jgi:hypothetical protein